MSCPSGPMMNPKPLRGSNHLTIPSAPSIDACSPITSLQTSKRGVTGPPGETEQLEVASALVRPPRSHPNRVPRTDRRDRTSSYKWPPPDHASPRSAPPGVAPDYL